MLQRVLVPLLLLSAVAAQRRVWVVDLAGGPGVHFTEIGPAVTAATDGDRIEVRGAGPYQPFVLDKALDVEAVANARVHACEVRGIPAGRSARIAGFRVLFDLNFRSSRPVWVHDCAGSVLFASFESSPTGPGLYAERCAAILIVDSRLSGTGHVPEYALLSAPGILARSAPITLQRSVVQGGPGASVGGFWGSSAGAPGCDLGSSLIAVASTVRGGPGGHGGRTSNCYSGQAGGTGIVTTDRCVVMERSQVAGGAGGNDGGCGAGGLARSVIGALGNPAAVTTDSVLSGAAASNIVVIPPLPTTSTPAQANLGQPVVTTVRGSVGAPALVLMDFDHSHAVIAGIQAPLLLQPGSMFPIAVGTVGVGGTFVVSIPVPLDPVLRNELVFQQSVVVSNQTIVELSSLADLRLR